jgi:hypothetical protein
LPSERHGSRWLYDAPDEAQVKEWFNTQPLHPGMDHGPYLGGIVIITAKEKFQQTMANASGAAFVRESERTVYVPYVKVDTRIAYFWDLVRQMTEADPKDREFVGVIEPVPVKVITDPSSAYYNEHLPEGFFILPIRNSDEGHNRYLGARWRTAIYERESYARVLNGSKERPVLQGIGTKQSLLAKRYADDNVVMKAETGAIGRALGVAGILVVGTGVATAEDMQEAQAAPSQPSPSEAPQASLPPVQGAIQGAEAGQVSAPPAEAPAEETPQDQDAANQQRVRDLAAELKAEFPEAFQEYSRWYTEDRQFPAVDQLTGPALSGAIVKLERTLDEQRRAVSS